MSGEVESQTPNIPELLALYFPYISLVMCSCGILINILFIFILSRKSIFSRSNLILIIVAACDIFVMTLNMPRMLHMVYFREMIQMTCDVQKGPDLTWMLAVFACFFANGTSTAICMTTWLTVYLGFIRWHIIRRSTMIESGAAKTKPIYRSLAVLAVVVLLLQLPNFVAFEIHPTACTRAVHQCQALDNRTDCYVFHWTELGARDDQLLVWVSFWWSAVSGKIIPSGLLAIAFIGLFAELYKRKVRLQAMRSRADPTTDVATSRVPHDPPSINQRNSSRCWSSPALRSPTDSITTALSIILLMFVITRLPQIVVLTIGAVRGRRGIANLYMEFRDIFDFLQLTSSMINFFIYCMMSSKFRAHLKLYLRRWARLPCRAQLAAPHPAHV